MLVAEGKVNSGMVSITYGYVFDSTGKLVGRQAAGESKLQYYVTNGHGDVTELRDALGNLLNSYSYDIWGNPTTVQETVTNSLRYAGEYWDADTNLQYLRARWYDPAAARFIGEDTYEGELTNPLSLNLYTYVYNNPLIYVDPTGHDTYFFYGLPHGSNGGFEERAEIDAQRWEKQKKTKAHVSGISSEKEFIRLWKEMGSNGEKIELVSLYFHSNSNNLILDYTKDEYLTTNQNGLTGGGRSATWIGSLQVQDIETIILYACNSAHLDYAATNLALTFLHYQNVQEVYGWDGSMKWSGKKGDTMLANNQDYFKSHLPEGINRKASGLIKYSKVGKYHYSYRKVEHYKKNWQGKRIWGSTF